MEEAGEITEIGDIQGENSQDEDIKPNIVIKKRYNQKARAAWLQDDLLKDWLVIDDDNPNFVRCRYCDKSLKAKRYSLNEHMGSKKHIDAAFEHSGYGQLSHDAFETTDAGEIEYLEDDDFDEEPMLKRPRNEDEEDHSYKTPQQQRYSIKVLGSTSAKVQSSQGGATGATSAAPKTLGVGLKRPHYFEDEELVQLKKTKLRLDLQLAAVTIYKTRLEALELEKRLGLPRTVHTIQFGDYEVVEAGQ